VSLDVSQPPACKEQFDAVFSANTVHIMSESTVVEMLAVVRERIRPGGRFLLYGPFRIDGQFTSDSNRQFDHSLRSRDSDMGIRDLEWLDELATTAGLRRIASFAMPANNLMLVWQFVSAPRRSDN
jgi:cyclopropane fatty-acyl-phospholipid synthase-like methyltransferase